VTKVREKQKESRESGVVELDETKLNLKLEA
jgi:hypothetical protein